jgi:hypothetical protein
MASIHQYKQRQYELIESILGNFGPIIALLSTSISAIGYCNGDIHFACILARRIKGPCRTSGDSGWVHLHHKGTNQMANPSCFSSMELANGSHIMIYFQATNSAKLEKRYSREWFEGREAAGPLTLRTPLPTPGERPAPAPPLAKNFNAPPPTPHPANASETLYPILRIAHQHWNNRDLP